jgi:hypothetical protein
MSFCLRLLRDIGLPFFAEMRIHEQEFVSYFICTAPSCGLIQNR